MYGRFLIEFLSPSENRCGPLPFVDNATVHEYSSNGNSTAVVTCIRGYRFDDGESEKILTCGDDMQWDFFGHCERKIKDIHKLKDN